MATLARGKTFGATEEVTNSKLHQLVDSGSISGIVQADIAASSGIVVTSASAPSDTDALWIDSSGTRVVKFHDGSSFVRISPAATIENLDTVTADGSALLTSSTAEETLHTFSVPANTLGTNAVLRFKIWVEMDNANAVTPAITARYKYGATTMITNTAFGLSVSQTNGLLLIEGFLKGTGANTQAAFAYNIEVHSPDAQVDGTAGHGTAAEDESGALNFVVTLQSDTSDAGLALTKRLAIIEKLEAV